MGFWERRGSLIVIYDFDFVDVFAFPTKAEAPLVVGANAVLTSYRLPKYNAVLSQRFVAVVRYSRGRARLQRRGEREFPSGGFPFAFTSSAVRLTVLRSFSPVSYPWLLARPELRSSSVGPARRPSSHAYSCARTVSVANPAGPMPQTRRQLGEPLRLARRLVFGQPGSTVMADERVISKPS